MGDFDASEFKTSPFRGKRIKRIRTKITTAQKTRVKITEKTVKIFFYFRFKK